MLGSAVGCRNHQGCGFVERTAVERAGKSMLLKTNEVYDGKKGTLRAGFSMVFLSKFASLNLPIILYLSPRFRAVQSSGLSHLPQPSFVVKHHFFPEGRTQGIKGFTRRFVQILIQQHEIVATEALEHLALGANCCEDHRN